MTDLFATRLKIRTVGAKAVNQMRNIEQIPELTDEEWPEATEDRISTVFADHAIQKIIEAYNNGEILEEGVETWNI